MVIAGSKEPNWFQQLKKGSPELNQTGPRPRQLEDLQFSSSSVWKSFPRVTPQHNPAHLPASRGKDPADSGAARGCCRGEQMGRGPQEPRAALPSQRACRLAAWLGGTGRGGAAEAPVCACVGVRCVSRTEAQLHGVVQGRQGPPLPQGADGRTQPQRRLLFLGRRAAPPPLLPVRFVHMDGKGLLSSDRPPHRRSMALTAAPLRLRGERPVSAADGPARPAADSRR